MTRYEDLQTAMTAASARDSARLERVHGERAAVWTILCALVERLRSDLGLPANAAEVFLSNPRSEDPRPDNLGHSVVTEDDHHAIRLDVTIKPPVEAPRRFIGHGLYAVLEIRALENDRYELGFEGTKPPHEHRVVVDANDPQTFSRFSDEIIDALMTYYETFAMRTTGSSVGFIKSSR